MPKIKNKFFVTFSGLTIVIISLFITILFSNFYQQINNYFTETRGILEIFTRLSIVEQKAVIALFNSNYGAFFYYFLQVNKLLIICMSSLIVGIMTIAYRFCWRSFTQPLENMQMYIEKLPNDFRATAIDFEEIIMPQEFNQLLQKFMGNYFKLKESYLKSEQFQKYASHELHNELILIEHAAKNNDIAKIEQISQKLEKTIEDLLVLSEMVGHYDFIQIDPVLVLAEVIDYLKDERIILDIDNYVGCELLGKAGWFFRIFINLLQNAQKYSIRQTPIFVQVQQFEHNITICFENLVPIDFNGKLNIFEQNFIKNEAGFGIGLHLVQSIIEKFSGVIYDEFFIDEQRLKIYISLPL